MTRPETDEDENKHMQLETGTISDVETELTAFTKSETWQDYIAAMESTRYHEAGHCIVSLIGRGRARYIAVEDNCAGHFMSKPRIPKDLATYYDIARETWAGVIADGMAARKGRHARGSRAIRLQGFAGNDYESREKSDARGLYRIGNAPVSLGLIKSGDINFVELLQGMAAGRLLRLNWAAVEAVAEALDYYSDEHEGDEHEGDETYFGIDHVDIAGALRKLTLCDLNGQKYRVRAYKTGFARATRVSK